MKENEGQVLFTVDRTQDSWRRSRQEELHREMIEGYRTHRLLSALGKLLGYIVREWQTTHPTVDVAQLCQLLAENSPDWAPSAEREELAVWLDFLDAQLIALMEEQHAREITPDDLQALLQRSLLMLQLESEPEGVLTAELANDLLYARVQSIRSRFPARRQRQNFYRLGFPPSDCETVESNKDDLLAKFLAARDYCRWPTATRCDFLASVLAFLLRLRELRPHESSLPGKLKENWQQVWRHVLALWLQGHTCNEMIDHLSVAQATDSPAELSVFIDDLFCYRAPWGLNALSAYLQQIATETGQELPSITDYFPALLKYGVHSPAASSLLALGLESRKLALKLASHCPDDEMRPGLLLAWFIGLTQRELASLGLPQDEIKAVLDVQREARGISQVAPREGRAWTIAIAVPDHVLVAVEEGDTLVLRPRPEIGSRSFALHTLWGDPLDIFELPHEVPELFSSPDQIDVTVLEIQRQPEGSSVTLRIEEV